ncbi:hypothetical protein FN846DRAFT_362856 [Sphaerosporella brunnea]|uniref:Uncharacterized protein n=1 Tax=Sphaerosporella brunnea TaxID=1250544 RepID=A0A5J5EHY7_9PEZI|nr:hypothetical protein FN846DRAFT_362856 [Sphaerosporella brunnea]
MFCARTGSRKRAVAHVIYALILFRTVTLYKIKTRLPCRPWKGVMSSPSGDAMYPDPQNFDSTSKSHPHHRARCSAWVVRRNAHLISLQLHIQNSNSKNSISAPKKNGY